mmetsp:Transcript_8743/g.24968  ORF Transcript_8743/g.24968 Transcript_8743/m.24968 type:complete len:273 (+) Transcript_8743:391-1209(+)
MRVATKTTIFAAHVLASKKPAVQCVVIKVHPPPAKHRIKKARRAPSDKKTVVGFERGVAHNPAIPTVDLQPTTLGDFHVRVHVGARKHDVVAVVEHLLERPLHERDLHLFILLFALVTRCGLVDRELPILVGWQHGILRAPRNRRDQAVRTEVQAVSGEHLGDVVAKVVRKVLLERGGLYECLNDEIGLLQLVVELGQRGAEGGAEVASADDHDFLASAQGHAFEVFKVLRVLERVDFVLEGKGDVRCEHVQLARFARWRQEAPVISERGPV